MQETEGEKEEKRPREVKQESDSLLFDQVDLVHCYQRQQHLK